MAQASFPAQLLSQIEIILLDLLDLTNAESVILANADGQLVSVQGDTQEIDPALIAALGAADVMATAELIRHIGGHATGSALFRQGRRVNVYLFDIDARFVLIVVFRPGILAGLVQTFGRRAVRKLKPLVVELEGHSDHLLADTHAGFGSALSEEMDKTFDLS